MRLLAISDMHLDFEANMLALERLQPHKEDWLITGGDLCTTLKDLRRSLEILRERFAKLFWVPGNHELWSSKDTPNALETRHGEDKYSALVALCREFEVSTPEDPFVLWPTYSSLENLNTQASEKPKQPSLWIAPLFVPYDYSFRPDEVPLESAIEWAMESGVLCSDEKLIQSNPYKNIVEWSKKRVAYSENRLRALPKEDQTVLINHFPLRQDLVRIRRIPRFSIWCGTKATEDWHLRYRAKVVVSGHLHVRATDYRDGVRFEEVSMGYPRDWDAGLGIAAYLREILPGPNDARKLERGTHWRGFGP